jgi:magnesium transporter
LAVEDALQESHVPKLDDWGDYLYIVLHAVVFDRQAGEGSHIDTVELDAFLGHNYIVTHHDQPVSPLNRVWSDCQRDERHLAKGVDHLLYLLTDALADSYLATVDEMDEALDEVEVEVISGPDSNVLARLFSFKRALLHLRRIIAPQREVLSKLARDDYAVIDSHDRVFFRDVYDHLVRLYDIIESMRDLVAGALDIYLSVINNRMNEVMKTLTLITTVFMPISFLASFFGMNFFQPIMPAEPWTGPPVFVLVLAVTVAAPTTMYLWMRSRRFM